MDVWHLRNVQSILYNLYHEELRMFCKQKSSPSTLYYQGVTNEVATEYTSIHALVKSNHYNQALINWINQKTDIYNFCFLKIGYGFYCQV